jgi:hypothetical protein
MQLEHCHVEKDRYQDHTDGPRKKMPHPRPCTHTEIAQREPQLQDGARTNRRKAKRSTHLQDTTRPPVFGKWFLLIHIGKAHEKESAT